MERRFNFIIVFMLILANVVSFSPLNAYAFSPRTTAPEANNECWYSKKNPYYASNLAGECTWYVWGRAYEILGRSPGYATYPGAGKNIYDNCAALYERNNTPSVGAIACWTNASNGHVAMVEKVDSDGTVWVSQYNANWDHQFSYAHKPNMSGFQGYVHLLQTQNNTSENTNQTSSTNSISLNILNVVEATYGGKNVRDYVDRAVNGGQSSFRVCNDFFGGDPQPGQSKALYIKYDSNQGQQTASIKEGDTINIDRTDNRSKQLEPGSRQIIVYEHDNYGGQYKVLEIGTYNNPAQMGYPDNMISSIKVGTEVKVRFGEHDNFGGRTSEITSSVSNFGGSDWSDKISSIEVSLRNPVQAVSDPGPGQVILYENDNYSGQSKVLDIGTYSNPAQMGFPNDALSSIKVGPQTKIRLGEHDDFGGRTMEFISNVPSLSSNSFNDTVSSVEVSDNQPTPIATPAATPNPVQTNVILPDLCINEFSYSNNVIYEQIFFVNLQIINRGNVETSGFKITWVASKERGGDFLLTGVPANSTVNTGFYFSPTVVGNDSVFIIVDSDNSVNESDEENNRTTIDFEVALPTPTPAISVTPTPVAAPTPLPTATPLPNFTPESSPAQAIQNRFSDIYDNELIRDVNILYERGILTGYADGTFDPDKTISRAEFAAVICRFMGIEQLANTSRENPIFYDVLSDHWASGYINLAYQSNVINGMGNGSFQPDDPVTREQAIKMIVCAIGKKEDAEAAGGYPDGYLQVAEKMGITNGVATIYYAQRAMVAQMLYNALNLNGISTASESNNNEGIEGVDYIVINGEKIYIN